MGIQEDQIVNQKQNLKSRSKWKVWVWDALIVLILLVGAYFRFTGIRWDASYHLHPDERFLTMVATAITPAENLEQYFDTANSPLNPNNRGYTFYVYGTLPLFIVRYIGEWIGQTGYDQINVVGRAVSGAFDLGTIFLVFLIGKKLYNNSKLGLLAALFSSLAVLQIQLSHYFTVDNVSNFFAYAAIFAALFIVTAVDQDSNFIAEPPKTGFLNGISMTNWNSFVAYAAFGILFGLALASKVSMWALAALLPLSSFIYYSKLSPEKKEREVLLIIRNLVLAGVLALLTFRVFQPYAFSGPGFLGLKLNPNWIGNLKELSNLSTGDVDVPYALQWARRPITFALTNLVQWGLGIPMGVLALSGFLWMGWRMVKGDWAKHILLWSWVAFILGTQSFNWVRSMRYLLPLYPALALIASWTIFKLWSNGSNVVRKIISINIQWQRILAVSVALIALSGSTLWAVAFTQIYTKPVTRVAASEWIFENIPAAINLQIESDSGLKVVQPLAYQNSALISSEQSFVYGFIPKTKGIISAVFIEHVLNQQSQDSILSLLVMIREKMPSGEVVIASGFYQSNFQPTADPRGESVRIPMDHPIELIPENDYELVLQIVDPGKFLKLDGGVGLEFNAGTSKTIQYLPAPVFRLTASTPFQTSFTPLESGIISKINLNRVVDLLNLDNNKTLVLSILDASKPDQLLASGRITDPFLATSDPRGNTQVVPLNQSLQVDSQKSYILQLTLSGGAGAIGIYNDVPVIESTWDDPLPLGMYGYNVFGFENGLYGNTRNLEIYWDDTKQKKDLFYSTLDQADAIFISSNRQWGTTTRVPERYPFTTEYYRSLLGCPAEKDILWCYSVAKPGMFIGKLGFKLTAVFQSDPTLGNISINDQFAEEAFTVYDHPKVLIFQKTDLYDPQQVRKMLDAVDITKAVHKTPRQASKFNGNLFLDSKQQSLQQAGGTWSEIFNKDSILNLTPGWAVVVWYLSVFLLGIAVYPLVRIVFTGLTDKGYPLSRLVGLLLTAYLTWFTSSTGLQFNRLTIGGILAALVLLNGFLAFKQRRELKEEIRTKKKYFLTVELLMLFLFLASLAIRFGNPDLWHPWKGGEKPMDLSYFTAVLKSTVFPPYDPWYSGGYINYYYFGFVITGVLVKFLGIIPGIAYNLILPTLFSFTGLGAFSFGWNLFAGSKELPSADQAKTGITVPRPLVAGMVSLFTVLIMGNLGSLRMIWQGLQRLVAPGGVIENARFIEQFSWFFGGLAKFFTGTRLNYGFGDWYWIPSRALPGDVITEFPFFTFTYADLHAHMIALPVTLLVLGWALSILLGKWRWNSGTNINRSVTIGISLLFGSLAIGTLRVTNTWDFPTFLALSAVIILYTIFLYVEIPDRLLPSLPIWLKKIFYSSGIIAVIVILSMVLFQPFTKFYGQAYGALDPWTGDHAQFWSFLVHWGLQLFLITTWFVMETREWLAATPVSALKKLKPYSGFIQMITVLVGLVLILITALGIQIGWLVGLLLIWALILILRPGQADSKRLVLFLIGTGLVLTLFVELFVLRGDIGRMNTVFKFYYQAWTLLGLGSAAGLIWLIPAVSDQWQQGVSAAWQVFLALLIFGVCLYPLTATADKIRDRISTIAPPSLNGLEFMQTSSYFDQGMDMDLSQDYLAIKWMQDNVQGSPVIVEANTVEYRWGNRFTIYTGLPGVLGWNWHQRQQRGFLDYNGISNRLVDIPNFYTTTVIENAVSFLKNYNVKYIILGQMELAYYPGEGLKKFEKYDGVYWKEVYREKSTVIYEVDQSLELTP
ncbi:MAG: DUF2298 domain-containing protein [Chloroflexi bacterium]|nr:DUF2298 domain-containing protein [Chloroflexota bacterium]